MVFRTFALSLETYPLAKCQGETSYYYYYYHTTTTTRYCWYRLRYRSSRGTDPGNADLRAAGLHQAAAGSSEHQGGMMAGHQASNDGGILGW